MGGVMYSYFDWAVGKLGDAPRTACAFWVDLDRMLASENGGQLANTDEQSLTDGRGRQWTVVRYRANPLPARRLLGDHDRLVLVWCVAGGARGRTDLTPFEDHLGRAAQVIEISLDAVAQETHPGLNLPSSLGPSLRGIAFDIPAYLDLLAALDAHSPVTFVRAMDALVELLCGAGRAISVLDPPDALASAARALASAPDANAIKAVRLALERTADYESRYADLLLSLARAEPRDIICTVYLATGLARLQVQNIGQVLAAEGYCPADLRVAFETARGKWSDIADRLNADGNAVLASTLEPTFDLKAWTRLRDLLAANAAALDRAATEPLPLVRAAALFGHAIAFVDGDRMTASAPAASETYREEFGALDLLAEAFRGAAASRDRWPPADAALDGVARAFTSGALGGASLALARGSVAFQGLEHLLDHEIGSALRRRLRKATQEVIQAMDRWDAAWLTAIGTDVESYLTHPRQGWRRTRAFTERRSGPAWLVVFDGLRFDLWSAIVAPALEEAGWRVPPDCLSFAYLPSLTEVARRTLIGASRGAARGDEEKLTEALAATSDLRPSYRLRSERVGKQPDEGKGWNVRVFSWPDKFVHSDLAELGTLAGQFELWIRSEFIPWLKLNVPKSARLAVSTDHGFSALDDDMAIEVGSGGGDDRNNARMLAGEHPDLGLVVDDGAKRVTLATSRRWYRPSGGRRWRFAHGGCTLLETLVPFAELIAVRQDAAEISIEGLPASVDLAEGAEAVLEFAIRVVGGKEMFPRVTLRAANKSVLDDHVTLGETRRFRVTLVGEERLTSLHLTVSSGPDREQRTVPVRVTLARIKRSTLDFDDV